MKPHAMLILVAGLLLAAAPRDDENKDAKDEIVKFQGTWKIDSVEVNGQKVPNEGFDDLRLTFDGEKYTQKRGGEVDERGTIKLDPSKSPKTIDFSIKEGNDAGKDQLGIYKFENGTLKLGLAQPGEKDRPKELASQPGSNAMIITLKREQEKV